WETYPNNSERIGRVYECISSPLSLLPTAPGAYDHSPIYKFDVDNPNGRDGSLAYRNGFSTAKWNENYAIIRFTRIVDGVEFQVHYYSVGSPSPQYRSENS